MEEKEYEDFFNKIRILKEEQEKQKKRGLNDYNLLTTVLKYHDEVRLHSRMIGSLLDIKGKHYQDELFLEKFLEIVGIKNYDVKTSKILLEYENIDLYLTDGINHIIIENKIWAGDQEAQIERYIKTVKNENKNIEIDNLYVIYLSIDRSYPSSYSLGDLKIINNNVICNKNNEKIAQYRAVRYKRDIISWLKQCQYEVQNITNLNEAFNNYKTVVKKITGDYISNIIQIEKYLRKDRELFKLAQKFYHENEKWAEYSKLEDLEKEVYHSYEKAREKIANDFFEIILVTYLKKELNENWRIENKIDHKDYKYKITVSNGAKKVIFASKGYGTNRDYIEINESKKSYVSKYKNRYAEKTINDFYKNKAEKYYLEICKKELT